MLEFLSSYLGMIIGITMMILLLVILASGYVRSPPGTALTISGLRKKTVTGKASIKIPFLERLGKLSLKLIPIDMKISTAVPTTDYINIQVDTAVSVKISSDPGRLAMTAKNFLNQNTEYIGRAAGEVLEGSMREVVGRMKLEEIVSDRQKFTELVKENTMPDLATMGLDTISFNVQNSSDSNGVIDDLGIDNISQIKKKAAIVRTRADKETAVAKAETNRQANDIKANSGREIAIKNNELDIQKTELKKNTDVRQAEADVAYRIQEKQQRKAIGITAAGANIAKQEKEIIIRQRMAEVVEKASDAKVRKKAEADKYARRQKAEAELYERQESVEVKESEVQQEVEAQKSRAETERFAREQEAQNIRMVGDAETGAVWAKGVAEAEAMEEKTEMYQRYIGAAVVEMMIKVLPEVAGKVVEPLAWIDKTTTIGGGSDSSGMDNVADSVTTVMMELFESMRETTGVDPGEVMKANTYDVRVNRDIHVTGVSGGGAVDGEIVKSIIRDSAQ